VTRVSSSARRRRCCTRRRTLTETVIASGSRITGKKEDETKKERERKGEKEGIGRKNKTFLRACVRASVNVLRKLRPGIFFVLLILGDGATRNTVHNTVRGGRNYVTGAKRRRHRREYHRPCTVIRHHRQHRRRTSRRCEVLYCRITRG